MKSIFTFFLVITLIISSIYNTQAQDLEPRGGEFIFNPDKVPCLTTDQREAIKIETNNNIEALKLQNKLAFNESNSRGGHPLFIWPLKQADGFSYNNTWAISGYVDHNSAYPNQLTDYNCGTRTYDAASGYNHQGVDMYLWPFIWNQMDNGQTEIIAAAPGQIIAKNDGQFDRSCDFNNNIWNAVYIQHNDGSIAWYGHMKNGSVTTKNVGDMVTLGEVLGTVGSSGNSTGPHLHFEIYTDNSYTQLVDPFMGTCNNMNSTSWWETQIPYNYSGINAALTHTAPPVIFPTCPTPETPNTSDSFQVDDTIYFAIYLRDLVAGTNVHLSIIKPDNTFLYDWNFTNQATQSSGYYYWYYTGVYDQEGEWKWEVTYAGETVTHTFNIGALSVDDEVLEPITIFPNPTRHSISIKTTKVLESASVYDISGKLIKSVNFNETSAYNIDISNVSKGLYFLSVVSNKNEQESFKIIKQ
ncbi:peptidoglycan DD-metalloendopeptidase family protein [Xanthomarina sp. F2636L]|uniref:peptidoglycan DD-metalloendopeptidase family protein n=1 Tax=Xanthomarina sp. F2636L TaxID=2996018 RepID=UPI00225E6E96|nr:peptidoglycan DD-metalloendopeptidase family protein [Xanthomarina sp. F2636L]MCX7551387.1 peptidoglycan DD-metalloendopeptidase family protein [Xanthomarina sp. F2636L]